MVEKSSSFIMKSGHVCFNDYEKTHEKNSSIYEKIIEFIFNIITAYKIQMIYLSWDGMIRIYERSSIIFGLIFFHSDAHTDFISYIFIT